MPVRVCEQCGGPLPEGCRSNRRFCDSCAKARYVESTQESRKRSREQRSREQSLATKTAKHCEQCGAELSDDCHLQTKFCTSCRKARDAKSSHEAVKRLRARLKEQKLVVQVVKRCEKCGADLPIGSHYSKRFCNECVLVNLSDRYRRRNQHSGRSRVLRYKYGLTDGDYNSMLEAQNCKCAICGDSFSTPGARMKSPCVDHDHVTGKVRGLLCQNCNKGLGFFNDSVKNLERAIAYLAKHHHQSLKLA